MSRCYLRIEQHVDRDIYNSMQWTSLMLLVERNSYER